MRNLGHIINQIRVKDTQKSPTRLGVAEIENAHILQELLQSKDLKNTEYTFVHFESKEERGIDTALVFNAAYFEVLEKKSAGSIF